MKIELAARTLPGAAVFCFLLMTVGCNSALTGGNSAGSTDPQPASVQGEGDWGMSLLSGGTVGVGQFPAKFTFDVTAAPDCVNDFVAFNTSHLGAAGTQANIVAFNHLYSTQGSVGGLCAQNGPSVYWAYYTGTVTGAGTAVTSVVLSGDGSKVAFVENVGSQAYLRILKWKAGQGAGAPVAPDTTLAAATTWTAGCPAANSCLRSIAFNNAATDTRSAPFYEYNTDTIYVGDNAGIMHKFTPVFADGGAPTEVTTGNWPITVHAGDILTSPVYDTVSGNIFVGDSVGRLSFIREVGSTVGAACGTLPCLDGTNLAVGTGGAIVDAPIVDGSTGMVFAVNGTETSGNFGTILQANTALVSQFTGSIGGSNTSPSAIYSGAFDNAYFTSAKPTIAGHMYVCGKDSAIRNRPFVYQINFVPATGVISSVGTRTFASGARWTSANGSACSPVTEFYNPNGGGAGVPEDWIFFSLGNRANNTATNNPVPAGACRTNNAGCVLSINVTSNPTWPLTLPSTLVVAAPTPGNNAGSTSGIVVDNTSTSSQASSFYFSLRSNSTGTGPGVPSCNTTAGVGCAVKLTQSALN